MITGNNTDTLGAAINGFMMEHGVRPSFILMSHDVFRSISAEVAANPHKYGKHVKVFGDRISFDNIEIAQVTGSSRVELVVDPLILKVGGRS